MTLPELGALDTQTLNALIEEYCYPTHHWCRVPTDGLGAGTWVLEHPDVSGKCWSSVPHLHYTADWSRVMVLFYRYDMALVWYEGRREVVSCLARLPAETEDEARHQIGRLALWSAMQRHDAARHGP